MWSWTVDAETAPWIGLFSEDVGVVDGLSVTEIRTSTGNVAGVSIPVLDGVAFAVEQPSLLETPSWIDDGRERVQRFVQLDVELEILQRQRELLEDELRRTSQRVNLFEKIKIPESRDAIRVIRIFLGDEQTAAVARAKIAKGKSLAREAAR